MTIKEFNNYPFTSKTKVKIKYDKKLPNKWYKIYAVDYDAKEVEISAPFISDYPIFCCARIIKEIKN